MSNHLKNESSPYLQQYLESPVNWYPWGEEALIKAKSEHKPIFLSIGYSTSHWCQVMAKESFNTPIIAEILNERFITIKVDKDERPDIDKYYQRIYQLMNRRAGGSPLSIFLTENLEPFYAASYISPEAKREEFGFEELLRTASKKYITEYETLSERGEETLAEINNKNKKIEATKLDINLMKTISLHVENLRDKKNGGFGTAPKFPNASTMMLLFDTYEEGEDEELLDAILLTLNQMIKGGFYDHIDGGFFRYSTDNKWIVPHFEKTSYDNALLSFLYIKSFHLTGDFSYLNIAFESIEFMLSKMCHEKLFYTTSFSQIEEENGVYFSYDYHEVVEKLKANNYSLLEVTKICTTLNITQDGNFKGRNIIRVDNKEELGEGYFPKVIELLKELREKNAYPFIDKKIITSWNAMMISTLFMAASTDEIYKPYAIESIEALLSQLYLNETLYHSKIGDEEPKHKAYLEDYAYLGEALIHAYQGTSDQKYLTIATTLTNKMIEQFYLYGKWMFSRGEIEIEEEIYDTDYPSSIATALSLLRSISSLVDPTYKKFLFKTLEINSYSIMRQPLSSPKLTHMTLEYLKDDIIIKQKSKTIN